MALQTQNLVMLGLGSLGDIPPNPYQPPLVDGIHLRWSFKRELGFPWYGFYLFRRPSRKGQPSCLSELTQLRSLPKGEQPAPTLNTPYGQLSSDRNLFLTDQFPAAVVPEFDLDKRMFLRFTFNPGEPVWHIELQLGFLSRGNVDVVGLLGDTPVVQTRVAGTPGSVVAVTIEADAISALELRQAPAVLIDLCFVPVSQSATAGWSLVPGFTYPLRLPVAQPAYPCTAGASEQLVSARNLARSRILYGDPNQFTAPPATLYNTGTITLANGSPIVHGAATAWDASFVGAALQVAGDLTAYTISAVVAPNRLVLSRRYAGASAAGKSYTINKDDFSQLHDHLAYLVTGGAAAGPMQNRALPAAAYNLGTIAVADGSSIVHGAGTAWSSQLQGLALQVVQASAGTVSLVNGSAVVTGAGTNWGGNLRRMLLQVAGDTAQYTIARVDSPTQLALDRAYGGPTAAARPYTIVDNTSYTIAAVNSPTQLMLSRSYAGASGGGKPYNIFAGLQPPEPGGVAPSMPRQYPLDLALLAALHPAVAQMIGLYWVDRSVESGASYDYLIVADYIGKAGLDGQKALSLIQQSGFADVEGYIVFNKRKAPAAQLAPPEGLRVYALPGGDIRAQDGVFAANSAGLNWSIGLSGLGVLLPGRAVLYHLWRADLGDAEPAAAPAASLYQLLTKNRPLLVAEPHIPSGKTPERSPDWPPFALGIIDKGLTDGWYSYQLSGIDLFGRHSANSAEAQWYQWGPLPAPRPWYYRDPPGFQTIHPFAVRLLDKIAPPLPTGVEAYALDPDDPTVLRDTLYNDWRATLSPAEQASVIGLRVRWQWTYAHMLQAPDTREFRIYFQPGTDLPAPDHSITTTWQERYYVVGYNEHVTVTTDASGRPLRKYEVLLPDAADSFRDGLSLSPSLAEPIVYAHIGVSAADDKAHTLDDPLWASGRWGGRFGNEGRVGPPAKIFRVLRERPAAPVPPADAERVYATPADYHSHSFYTYRWQPASYLKTHIFRALDDALFKLDWGLRPRAALTAAQTEFFPSAAIDPRWDAVKRQQVADELNQLDSFGHDAAATAQAMAYYRGLSNDALRVLAGLNGNERAFAQLTIQPLDPADPANADRKGPDSPDSYIPNPALRAYIDTLDGRSTNRYFYRAAYVDRAHNRGALSLAGPPVWLPDVVPPRAPSITKILGGDRQIAISWASNREVDLVEYRVYRADSQAAARDIRLMTLVHAESVAAGDPQSRPAQISWSDQPVAPNSDLLYRLTAVDDAGNESLPTSAVLAHAYRVDPPEAPLWSGGTHVPVGSDIVVRLTWTLAETLDVMIQRRQEGAHLWRTITDWLAAGTTTYDDATAETAETYSYRLRGRDSSGRQSDPSDELTVVPSA